ncbi:hypothetical protein GCM10007301_22610 [Azorhizobium oxalatiphilum]|uniref:Flavinylation-associated cytochrome domain-containing protein n=1 Tax=Azorhizobium oxalatiphilum TaxID=980631 RepID=A0A917BYZ2_9HYPH|nr:DUF4405 domain-containing protein [Azorhizobium oxalatiphilum]GGF62387.1 hypothetical protein GCM10007301_22610 [Azorhizobium oxalatiphilum]
MKPLYALRLVLDTLSAILFLVGLAYWWQDNLTHELAGCGLLLLLFAHASFNRHWYGSVAKGQYPPKRILNATIIALLLVSMAVLMVSSVLISKDVFAFLGVRFRPTARQAHVLAAYWAIPFIALHIGTRWTVVMNAIGRLSGFRGADRRTTMILRAASIVLLAFGLISTIEMGLGPKLLLQPNLDMWDFNDEAVGFFARYAAIIGMFGVIGHYGSGGLRIARSTKN